MSKAEGTQAPLVAGEQAWTVEDVASLAHTDRAVHLSDDPAWRNSIRRGNNYLTEYLANGGTIYGVTTGYGASAGVTVPDELIATLPLHLTRYHGCGLGRILEPGATRAVIGVRLRSLTQGLSGIRMELLEQLAALLNHDILPLIPEEGSVGASGDLTPLSYVAAALVGERNVLHKGTEKPAWQALSEAGLQPLTLHPKEGLAVMNGTSMMTGLACLAHVRAQYLAQVASIVTAMTAITLQSNAEHFHPRLMAAKPFPGQALAATWVRESLPSTPITPRRLQARYSVRCAPHIVGVLLDALPWIRQHIEIELNGASDNPIIDPNAEAVYHGGHFYGGHIAFAMDALKSAVANVADLLDRQMALLVDPNTNQDLPANLSGATGIKAAINHGFKAVQIGVSAWTAEALKQTIPATIFSRSTECHNQDKVSMGSIAARDAIRVLELTEQVAAAVLLCANQGLVLRQQRGEFDPADLPPALLAIHESILSICPFIEEDRPLEQPLRTLTQHLSHRMWDLGHLSQGDI